MPASPEQFALVTGATSGLGLACAEALLAGSPRWGVIVAGRDRGRLQAATASLEAEHGAGRARPLVLELDSLDAVRRAAAEVVHRRASGELPPLGALVLNAGTQTARGVDVTPDGIEATFGVNHLAHLLLATLLLPVLANDARVVFVSSGTHDPATQEGRFNPPYAVDVAALSDPARAGHSVMAGLRRYATSKLCNVLAAYELDRRVRLGTLPGAPTRLAVSAFDPGAVPGTGLTRSWGPVLRVLLTNPLLLRLAGVEHQTPAEAGRAMASLVLDPALRPTDAAQYMRARHGVAVKARSSSASYDTRLAGSLWDESVALIDRTAPARHAQPAA